jgi:hypothetical protein
VITFIIWKQIQRLHVSPGSLQEYLQINSGNVFHLQSVTSAFFVRYSSDSLLKAAYLD